MEREAQRGYWAQHSTQPTVEAMMLDSQAADIDRLERPEVLSTLGSVEGSSVLELGAGIGRFTGELAKQAKAVMACDFMETSIAENKRQHAALGNVNFLVADVTELQQAAESYDVVFSNWLLMYLSDEEVQDLAARILSWLRPGGTLFFRESCFRPSGDRPRHGNPTHYRNPRDYFAVFDSVEAVSADCNSTQHFELVCCKCVDTYVTLKKNQNQICWKFKKVITPRPRPLLYRTFLDSQQYSGSSIAQYEAVYGRGFISPGGREMSVSLLAELELTKGLRLLDLGCGIGGAAFLAADVYECHVHGIDLSVNAILIAIERAAEAASSRQSSLSTAATTQTAIGHVAGEAQQHEQQQCSSSAPQQQQAPHDVTFEVADMLTREFPAASFDLCISRDSLMHVADKQALFARLFTWLKPGGRLMVTDYCRAASIPSAGFEEYISDNKYHLMTLEQYKAVLLSVGFAGVEVQDKTADFKLSLEGELARLQASREAFVSAFSEEAYHNMTQRWKAKLQRAAAGEQLWAKLSATKPQAKGVQPPVS